MALGINKNTDKYAVLGNPIAHSKSPIIHAAFAKQTNQNISYEAILAPIDGFASTVNGLVAEGYKGLNVTVPFKFEAYNTCTQKSARALFAGAVNTLILNGNSIDGDNTDGAGLVRDITLNLGFALQHKRVLLLGAGGAAEGVLMPIVEQKPSTLTIANRSLPKAASMASKVSDDFTVNSVSFDALDNCEFDIIINATSTGLTDTALPIPNSIFAKDCLAYDMMYGRETPFMVQARNAGAIVADGLGMLVEQAAESFYIWRNVRPNTQPIIQMLRAQ